MTQSDKKNDVEPFVLSRTFDAPRELVFKAFTDAEHLRHWWGPKDFKVISSTMDLRPGGIYHFGLQAPDGSTMWGRFVFREIAAPERIVYVNSFSDEKGGLARHSMHAVWPLELLSTLLFEDAGSGRTRVTLSWFPINANDPECQAFDENRESMTGGWGGTFGKLEHYLAGLHSRSSKV